MKRSSTIVALACSAAALVGLLARSAAARMRLQRLCRWSASSRVSVGDGSMSVVAAAALEPPPPRSCSTTSATVEDWTLNGPMLDGISFVTGLKSGRELIRQRRTADQQVPELPVRHDRRPRSRRCSKACIACAAERSISGRCRSSRGRSSARTASSSITSISTTTSCGGKGRAVGAVIDGQLYLILLDAARSHYYDAALPDFEAIVASAQLPRLADRRDRPGRGLGARRRRAMARRCPGRAGGVSGGGVVGLAGLRVARVFAAAVRRGLVGKLLHLIGLSLQNRNAVAVPAGCPTRPCLAIGRAPLGAARAWRNW